MATDEAFRASVLELVGQLAEDGSGGIRPDSTLSDVGFDSLAFAELAVTVEERFGIDLVDGVPASPRTVADVVELIETAGESRRAGDGIRDGIGRFQRAAGRTAGGVLRWWFDIRVWDAERMPATGPVVLCMNHESLLDIPVAVVASPRPVTFMAKRELFGNRATARLFHELGGFSVDRAAFDLRAITIALDVARRGEVLGMYPEGTRTPGTLLPFLPGAAWIALHAGASLVPCAITGTDAAMPPGTRIPKRVPVVVAFGRPIPVDPVDDRVKRRAEAVRLTAELRASIEGLLAEADHG
ncbi:MAG: 1-acyl-sn-glycerol-3-phosphate acyltransferase [Actinomycetota bacterium]|nr:1-acyl-sn-glycerol-3-phosphate acyltransferase [Actinomycetota bacterium]